MKIINVVAAIIKRGNQFLCTQRNVNKFKYISYKFEFPGGKIETGETESDALIREIKEELDMDIVLETKYITVNHTYPDFNLIMHSYLCKPLNTHIDLKEHISYQWLGVNDLLKLDWAEADILIVNKLIEDHC